MTNKCPIPRQLKKRPRYGGLPVPFAGAVDPSTGRPLFGFNLRLKAITEKLCGQCGNPLGKVFAFLGDERACEKQVFKEVPMHLPCARYVLQICPYFTRDQHQRTKVPVGPTIAVLRFGDERMPPADRWGIYLTRSFEPRSTPMGQIVLLAGEQVGATLWYAHGKESK